MTADSSNFDELDVLIGQVLDGTLNDASRTRLADLLRASDEACLRYIETVHLSTDLEEWSRGSVEPALLHALSERGISEEELLADGFHKALFAGCDDSLPAWREERQATRVLGRTISLGLAAVAVSLLCFAAWFTWRDADELIAERAKQPVASLMADGNARWAAGFKPREGTKLMEGQTLNLVEGRAQVSMSCGADLVMKAPCSIELTSPTRVGLRNGLLSVKVADWTEEFTVAAEGVHIVDLGKQFVVSADAKTGAVEAHAIDGELRVLATNVSPERRRGLFVSSGEAIRIQPVTNISTRLKADDTLFDPGFEDAHPFKPVEIHNTGYGLVPGDEDSHWRIVASSADDFSDPRYAIVCESHRSSYLPNDPGVSQWVSISNPVDNNAPPNTMYTFETEFDLTGYDVSTVTIVANVLADNGVTAIRINDRPVAFKPWIHNNPDEEFKFKTFHKVEIAGGFVEGKNSIQFDVWNGVFTRRQEDHNPMALRVEWQAYGRLKTSAKPTVRVRRPNEAHLVPARAIVFDSPDKLPTRGRGHWEGV